MKKILALGASFLPFFLPVSALAQGTTPTPLVQIIIGRPSKGYFTLGDFVTNILVLSFAIAVLVVLVMLIWGAFEWITSGGDKDSVAKARNRIVNALIGLAVLAVAFALARVAAGFLGFDLSNIAIPTPNPSASGF